MTGKQNIVFWLGMALLITVFWFGGQLTSLWQTISPPGGSGIGGVSPPFNLPPGGGTGAGRVKGKRIGGKLTCPPSYEPDPTGTFCIHVTPKGM